MGIQKYPQKSLSSVIYGRPLLQTEQVYPGQAGITPMKKILMSGHNVVLEHYGSTGCGVFKQGEQN